MASIGVEYTPETGEMVLVVQEQDLPVIRMALPIVGSGGAPSNASYLVLGSNASLTSERVITAGANITITDNGPGSTVVIAASGGGGGGGNSYFPAGW